MGKAQRAVVDRDFEKAKRLMDEVLTLPIPKYFDLNIRYQAGEADFYAGYYSSALMHFKILMAEINEAPEKRDDEEGGVRDRVTRYYNACLAKKT